jgi:hypothetical protein
MSKKQRAFPLFLLKQPLAQPPDAGTGINDDDIIPRCSDFHAGRVAAIFDI